MGVVWFVPIIISILIGLEYLAVNKNSKIKEEISKKERRKASLILFGVLSVCQLFILLSFWPGGFPTDSLVQLNQAVLGAPLNDWHPVLHTLLFRLTYMIVPNPGVIVLMQMEAFALLCTMILMIGYDHGISLKKLCFFGMLFLLLPNQAISGIGAVKDYPYMLALLWGNYLLFRLMQNLEVCKKPWYIISFTLDLFFIYGLRHNGIMPVLFMVVLSIVITIKYRKNVQQYLILAVLIAVISIPVYKGSVFDMLEVTENEVSPYTTMFCAVGSCVNKNLPLSEEATAILEDIMPLEEWANYYSRFQGHDQYMEHHDWAPLNLSDVTVKEAFSVYLEALFKYPDVLIKDRVDGMDIMWDIVQPRDSFNLKALDFIQNFEFTEKIFEIDKLQQHSDANYYNDSWIATMYRHTIYPANAFLVDSIFWRTGGYIILFMVLLIFWFEHGLQRMLWTAMPMLGNIAGSVLLLYHQSFRYVYFIQVITMALLFLTICICREKCNVGLKDKKRIHNS